jgi:hypothetical protein
MKIPKMPEKLKQSHETQFGLDFNILQSVSFKLTYVINHEALNSASSCKKKKKRKKERERKFTNHPFYLFFFSSFCWWC